MFCYNCGKEVDDKAVVCPGCGAVLNEEALSAAKAAQARQQAENKAADKDEFFDAPPQQTPPPAYSQPAPQPAPQPVAQGSNTLAIVGFVLSFFVPIAGLICSILGIKRAPQYGGKGQGLAIAGLVISIVYWIIGIIISVTVLPELFASLGGGGYYPYF